MCLLNTLRKNLQGKKVKLHKQLLQPRKVLLLEWHEQVTDCINHSLLLKESKSLFIFVQFYFILISGNIEVRVKENKDLIRYTLCLIENNPLHNRSCFKTQSCFLPPYTFADTVQCIIYTERPPCLSEVPTLKKISILNKN